jgi:hypothetical protein
MADIDPQLLHLGSARERSERFEQGDPIQITPKRLLRHMMALGSSGSGKTVLAKVVVEEMTRLGLPAICIDPQGDICSLALALSSGEAEALAERGISPELAADFRERVEVVIFTPASRCGVPLCADPMHVDLSSLRERERIESISSVASMITSLIGFDLSNDDGEGIRAAFDTHLTQRFELSEYPSNLDEFSQQLNNLDEDERAALERFVNPKKLNQALKKLARLDVGARRLLFHEGLPLSIDLILGRGDRGGAESGKTRLAVIYLNTLNSAEDKEFIIATLAEQLYAWMLKNPSTDPQSIFYIDEVAPFIPPVRVPSCKPALSLIFKQARKYGVCCLMATQNPGDVDYKAMAQFGTWAIGRLTTRQDQRKIQPTINALDPDRADEIMSELPTQQAGEFMLISPDEFGETVKLRTRWLYSQHETLDDRRIRKLNDERWRARFLALEEKITQSHARISSNAKPTQQKQDSTSKTVSSSSSSSSGSSSSSNKSQQQSKSSTKNVSDTPSAEDLAMELLAQGDTYSATSLSETLSISRQKASRILKAALEEDKLAVFSQGRSQIYYSLESGARPDLDLPSKTMALIPKMSREEIEQRIEEHRQKSFLFGWISRDEKLLSRRLVYYVLYQVCFREDVEQSGLSAIFGAKVETVEDSIYLEPKTLKILSYEPGNPISLADQPAQFASKIPDFDGVSDLTSLSPGSVAFDEDSWRGRADIDTVEDAIKRRFSTLKITEVRPIFMPLWQLRYQEDGGHKIRLLNIDGLTGQPVNL